MKMFLAIAAGGALGALLRYLTVLAVARWAGVTFPWGTMTVNVVGSFVLGLLLEVLTNRQLLTPEWRGFLIIGGLGAFTTFSTFSMDAVALLDRGNWGPALAYIVGSVVLSVTAFFIAMRLGRWVVGPIG